VGRKIKWRLRVGFVDLGKGMLQYDNVEYKKRRVCMCLRDLRVRR